jgi:hypothetical protein
MINYFRQTIKTFEELHKQFPQHSLGKHLATALDGHNIWALSDKELLHCLQNYISELEFDVPHNENDVDDIIKQGLNLHNILEEEE